MLRPEHFLVYGGCFASIVVLFTLGKFENNFARFEVGNDRALIFSSWHDKVRIGQAPRDARDATLVHIGELLDGVLVIAQVPHIERRVGFIVVGNGKLRRILRIPDHFGISSTGLHLGAIHVEALIWEGLLKLEDRFGLAQIPNHNFAILTCRSQNVRHNSIPADRRDRTPIVQVGLAWLHGWLLQVASDVLYEYLGTARSQQVLHVWVEF